MNDFYKVIEVSLHELNRLSAIEKELKNMLPIIKSMQVNLEVKEIHLKKAVEFQTELARKVHDQSEEIVALKKQTVPQKEQIIDLEEALTCVQEENKKLRQALAMADINIKEAIQWKKQRET